MHLFLRLWVRVLFVVLVFFWQLLLHHLSPTLVQDYACVQQFDRGDAVFVFSGSDRPTATANLRTANGWIETVTGKSSHFESDGGGAGEAYFVRLNRFDTDIYCSSPTTATNFQCIVMESGTDAIVNFSGDAGGDFSLRTRSNGFVATIANDNASYTHVDGFVSETDYYVILLQRNQAAFCSFAGNQPSPTNPPPPTDPPPPPTNPAPTDPPPTNPPPAGGPLDFACVVGMAPNGIDALLTFSGSNRGTSENLRRFDVYVDTITGLTTYQTPWEGSSSDDFTVRVRGNGYSTNVEYTTITCTSEPTPTPTPFPIMPPTMSPTVPPTPLPTARPTGDPTVQPTPPSPVMVNPAIPLTCTVECLAGEGEIF